MATPYLRAPIAGAERQCRGRSRSPTAAMAEDQQQYSAGNTQTYAIVAEAQGERVLPRDHGVGCSVDASAAQVEVALSAFLA